MKRIATLLAVLVPALALAGCAAPGKPVAVAPSAPPATVIPPAPPSGEPFGYEDMLASQLRQRFGAPAFVRHDGRSEMWRYDGASCRAFFFLYGEGKDSVVRHVETLPRGANSAADPACLTALRASPAKTS